MHHFRTQIRQVRHSHQVHMLMPLLSRHLPSLRHLLPGLRVGSLVIRAMSLSRERKMSPSDKVSTGWLLRFPLLEGLKSPHTIDQLRTFSSLLPLRPGQRQATRAGARRATTSRDRASPSFPLIPNIQLDRSPDWIRNQSRVQVHPPWNTAIIRKSRHRKRSNTQLDIHNIHPRRPTTRCEGPHPWTRPSPRLPRVTTERTGLMIRSYAGPPL